MNQTCLMGNGENQALWAGRGLCTCMIREVKTTSTIWESGHFYQSKGPTQWSQVGWEIASQLRGSNDHTMILVDDVHPIEQVHPLERKLERIEFAPKPCMTVLESAMEAQGFQILEDLKQLSRRRRARNTMKPKRWCCSGHALTTPNGTQPAEPLCLLYDLGLTKTKYDIGFRNATNVLPAFYESEQRALIRIARKVMPDLNLQTVLYELDGQWRLLRREDVCL